MCKIEDIINLHGLFEASSGLFYLIAFHSFMPDLTCNARHSWRCLCLTAACMLARADKNNTSHWTNEPFYLPLCLTGTELCQLLKSNIELHVLQPVYALFNLGETRQNIWQFKTEWILNHMFFITNHTSYSGQAWTLYPWSSLVVQEVLRCFL